MLPIEGPRLNVARDMIRGIPSSTTVIAVLHALSDSREFISHLLEAGHSVPHIFAKPFSRDASVVRDLRAMGVEVHERPYAELEGTSILTDTIRKVRDGVSANLAILDVGGYFAKPLAHMSEGCAESLPDGVLEVTTFGHNRYLEQASRIKAPIVSVARSPLKDVESVFVGESAWVALDLLLRQAGLSVFGGKFGMVGYGMIGRRVADAARAGGAHTSVFDLDPLKLLDARSYRHQVKQSLGDLLGNNDIVIASTGGMSVSAEAIQEHAKDGLILGSAGSRVQEIDVAGLDRLAVSQQEIHDNLREYVLSNGKRIYLLRKGTSINFFVGSCPDETMDIVFSEIAAGIRMVLHDKPSHGQIHEVDQDVRRQIARDWLKLRA